MRVRATPDQTMKLIDEYCRKNFAKSGVVSLVIKGPDGALSSHLFKVDPTKHSYEEWEKLLAAQFN
jgi:hypothetical protein